MVTTGRNESIFCSWGLKFEGYSKAHITKEVIGRLVENANYYHCIQ